MNRYDVVIEIVKRVQFELSAADPCEASRVAMIVVANEDFRPGDTAVSARVISTEFLLPHTDELKRTPTPGPGRTIRNSGAEYE